MIVKITWAAMLLCVVGVGAGAPTVGMSPAIAETERTQVRVSATKNRFMVCCSCFLRVERRCKNFYIGQIRPISQVFLQGLLLETNIRPLLHGLLHSF